MPDFSHLAESGTGEITTPAILFRSSRSDSYWFDCIRFVFFMINRPLFMYACMGLGAVICLYYLDSELKEGNLENQNSEFRIKPDQHKTKLAEE
ncbi:MAG: hypothetical protein R2778_09405 [Saprospiraceae bacterium]